jgi:hypothetical protein
MNSVIMSDRRVIEWYYGHSYHRRIKDQALLYPQFVKLLHLHKFPTSTHRRRAATMLSSSLLATSLLLSGALGARLPLTGVRKTALVDPPGLLRRDAHSISLNDSQDILYYANM